MLENLFNTFELKGKTIKNRLVVPAMVTNYCNNDGSATERYIAYHEEKARGGWGIIITEDYAVDPLGRGFSNVAGLWNDVQIESHKELPKRVKVHGSTILAQIYHAGRQTNDGVLGTGVSPVAPSAIMCPFGTTLPRELSVLEIEEIVEKFAQTANRAKQCGFDGIEIHGGHGYLVAGFLSLYSNKRMDKYGGSIERRARFAIDIVKAIRDLCGEDFIIGFRISADEFIEGGRGIEETKVITSMLEESGVDLIHVSAGVYGSADKIVPSYYTKPAWIADFASEIKKALNIPVITVGRINDPHIANSVIKEKKADFVAMGRASLTDPAFPKKAKAGNFAQIRKCIACNHGCLGILFSDNPIKCVLNPELGNEYLGGITKLGNSKKIAVIGSGPAGLEAAIGAAKLGHHVTVFEKDKKAGGQWYLASIPPGKGELAAFTQWQLTELEKLGVTVNLNVEITPDSFDDLQFDEVVVATGATPVKPPIKGNDLPHVAFANDVLAGIVGAGMNVIIIGGGQVGAETAAHLGMNLRNVTLVEMGGTIAADEALAPRWHLLRTLEERKVNVMMNAKVKEIKEESVIVQVNGTDNEIVADTVLFATGSNSNRTLAEQLIKKGVAVRVIGDAFEVGNVLNAVEAGYNLADTL